MSGIKRHLEDVSLAMGKDGGIDDEVLRESDLNEAAEQEFAMREYERGIK